MASRSTPTQRLAALTLGQPLKSYVTDKRNAHPRWSWRLIAEQLDTDTDGQIKVSAETLRVWYGSTTEAAA